MFPFFFNKRTEPLAYPETAHTRNEMNNNNTDNYNNNNNNHGNNGNNTINSPPPVYSNSIIRYRYEHKRRFFGITTCLCIVFLVIILSSIFSVGRYNGYNRYNGYGNRRPF